MKWLSVGTMLACMLWASHVAAQDDYYLWLLDEGGGDVAAGGGTAGIDLKLVQPQWPADGPFPGTSALGLNGSGAHAVFEGHVTGEQGTIEMWLRPRRLAGDQALFSTRFGSTSRLMFALRDGDLVGRDHWWKKQQDVVAPGAFTPGDVGRWAHVALTWGPGGYRLYRDGKLLARRPGDPFPSRRVRGAIGINAWDLASSPLAGDVAQVRLSAVPLEPGGGSGRGELAWQAPLDHARLLRPTLAWQPGPNMSNLYVRDPRPVLKLEVRNRFGVPLPAPTIRITARDRFLDAEPAPRTIELAGPLAPRSAQVIEVDPGIARAGSYRVTAIGPQDSRAVTTVTWVVGPAPEEPGGEVPFFGTCSHDPIIPWAYQARREFGSRMERGRVYWRTAQDDEGKFRWTDDIEDDPIRKVIIANEGTACGFTGYTPAFASAEPEGKRDAHDVPDIGHYVRWVEAATRHYLGTIRYWEIWNEPNGAGTFFRGSAEQLADLHKAAFLAARRVDPGLRIVGASLVGVDPEYMDRLADAGALDYMDVISFHSYVWGRPAEPNIVANLDRIIAWRDERAPGRPLWDFEWGYDATAGDLRRHAAMTAAQLIITRARGLQHSAFYTWSWHAYHLFDGYRPEPAAIAYRTVAQHLTNAGPVAVVSEGRDDVYAYLFERRGVLTLVAWLCGRRAGELGPVPVDPHHVAARGLMGNPVEVAHADGAVRLPLSDCPVFLTGVSPVYAERGWPAPQVDTRSPPPPVHPSLWYSFHYPDGSEVVGLPRGRARHLAFTVYNDGSEPARGRLTLRARGERLRVAPAEIDVAVPPRSHRVYTADVSAPAGLSDGLYRVDVRGAVDDVSFGRMSVRCEVADGEAALFHMATREMARHTVDAGGYGQGIHIRWYQPGGFHTFRFDLTGVASARLAGYMDSISPALTDGGNFRVSASADGEQWDVLLDGRGPWAWRTVDLTPYVGGPAFVRFEHPKTTIAKGQARVRQWRLVTWRGSGGQ